MNNLDKLGRLDQFGVIPVIYSISVDCDSLQKTKGE